MNIKCDFSGWATRNDLLCGDGRTIRKDAFKDNDGQTVPLVWNHDHSRADAVLGHAVLENRNEGVYAYATFNDTEAGKHAKAMVNNGDVRSLSIYANKLKQIGGDVIHGCIREISLVLAGANPGAEIDFVMSHSEEGEEELYANWDESAIVVYHAESEKKEESNMAETKTENKERTVQDVIDTMTEEQKTVMYALIGEVVNTYENNEDDEDDEGDDEDMRHNIFDQDEQRSNFLSHSDQENIIKLAKTPGVGSLQQAIMMYAEENDELMHSIFDGEALGTLLPEYELIDPQAPPILYDDDTWVSGVINGVHKSPYARVRTRRADARKAQLENELRALGYPNKGAYKKEGNKIKLLTRSHDPQTIYVKDSLNRDDVLDITDFDLVSYNNQVLTHTLHQEIATAILIGDGREDIDPDKIKEDHIRSIWHDDELYCIHQDVDIEAQREALQGTDTEVHFGENYIYAEAIIEAALYSREKYKGSGNLTFYCTPHLLNVMLLARDFNGRRIYSSKSDLVAAFNVKNIITVEQFDGLTRVTDDGKTKKLLGLFVNLSDYQVGCVKGGQITKFEDFDIDFNQLKTLLETRISGALVEWYSAIALEEDITGNN